MADETLTSPVRLRGGAVPAEAFPPGSNFVFIDGLTTRANDVDIVAQKAVSAANGAYDAQVKNDEQDVQLVSLDNRVTSAEVILQNHEGRIKKNEDDIVQLQADVTQLQTDVSTLQTDVSAIKVDYVSKAATAPQSLASPLNVTTSYSVGGVKVVGPRQAGWTAAGGTVAANIGAWSPNTLAAASATYNQTEATQTRTQLNAAEARIKALEAAMRAHGLIN